MILSGIAFVAFRHQPAMAQAGSRSANRIINRPASVTTPGAISFPSAPPNGATLDPDSATVGQGSAANGLNPRPTLGTGNSPSSALDHRGTGQPIRRSQP